MTTYAQRAAEAATFTQTAALVPTLTIDEGRPIIRNASGVAVAVLYVLPDGRVDVDTDTFSRNCLNTEEAIFFTAAVLTGEWDFVAAGANASPLDRNY